MAGLQPVEGVWVPLWQLAPAKEGHGVLWGQCGMWQLPHGTSGAVWGFLFQPNSTPGPCGNSFVAADCGASGGRLGGTTGGIKCDPEVNLQMIP